MLTSLLWLQINIWNCYGCLPAASAHPGSRQIILLCMWAEAQLEAGLMTSALCSTVLPWRPVPGNPLDFSYSVNSCILRSTLYGLRMWGGISNPPTCVTDVFVHEDQGSIFP